MSLKLEIAAMKGELADLKNRKNSLVLTIQDRVKSAKTHLQMFEMRKISEVDIAAAARELNEAAEQKKTLEEIQAQISKIEAELS